MKVHKKIHLTTLLNNIQTSINGNIERLEVGKQAIFPKISRNFQNCFDHPRRLKSRVAPNKHLSNNLDNSSPRVVLVSEHHLVFWQNLARLSLDPRIQTPCQPSQESQC